MANVKGNRFLNRLAYLRGRDPGGLEDRILAGLEPAFARRIREGLVKNHWYPVSQYVLFHRLLDRHLGQGDGALVRELGRLSARDAFQGVYRVFFKYGSPDFIITSAPIMWRQVYDSGRMDIWKEQAGGRRQYRMVISEFDEPAEELWLILEGWIEGTLALAGMQSARAWRSPERLAPDSNAEIMAAWDG